MRKKNLRTLVTAGLLTLAVTVQAGNGTFYPPISGRWVPSDKDIALGGNLCTSSAMLWGDHVTVKVPQGANTFEGLVGLTSQGASTVLTIKADAQERETLALRYGQAYPVRIALEGAKTLTLAVPRAFPAVTVCNPAFK
jgi:hypothetical protein